MRYTFKYKVMTPGILTQFKKYVNTRPSPTVAIFNFGEIPDWKGILIANAAYPNSTMCAWGGGGENSTPQYFDGN